MSQYLCVSAFLIQQRGKKYCGVELRTSRDVIESDGKHRMLSFAEVEPIVVVEGKGATVKDIEGKEYIDCFACEIIFSIPA